VLSLCRWGSLKAVVEGIKVQVHLWLPSTQRCSRTVLHLASCACTPCSVTARPRLISMLASCRVCIILKTETADVIAGIVLNWNHKEALTHGISLFSGCFCSKKRWHIKRHVTVWFQIITQFQFQRWVFCNWRKKNLNSLVNSKNKEHRHTIIGFVL